MNNQVPSSNSWDQRDPFWTLMLLAGLAFLVWWVFFRKDGGVAAIPTAALPVPSAVPLEPQSLISTWSPLS